MSSTITQKLERYLVGESLQYTELPAEQAKAHRVRLHRSAWGTTLVEPGAVCTSARLAPEGELAFIGAESYVNDGGYLKGRVFIGRFCSIGRRVSLGAAAHRMAGLSTSPFFRRCAGDDQDAALVQAMFGSRPTEPRTGPTIIGHDVWIGDGAVIGAGVQVGTGAVIGANAVVTRDVEPYRVVRAGAPAAERFRFSADIVTQLLATAWWEISPNALRELPARNVLQTLTALKSKQPAAALMPTLMPVPPAA
jgi:virginiamycin A acetyltransferase